MADAAQRIDLVSGEDLPPTRDVLTPGRRGSIARKIRQSISIGLRRRRRKRSTRRAQSLHVLRPRLITLGRASVFKELFRRVNKYEVLDGLRKGLKRKCDALAAELTYGSRS
jgi:hypothetical protein